MKENINRRLLNLVWIALFAGLISVCAWITVPATVPFTMQSFGVFLTLCILGGKRGSAAVGVYLLLGAIGVPVFSSFTGGIGRLLGPTGGYLIGFLFQALLYWGMTTIWKNRLPGLLLGQVCCYAFGTAWFCVISKTSFLPALLLCVVPFLIPDLLKLFLALLLEKLLKKTGITQIFS